MRPKAYLLHSLRLSDWKSESFVFFVVYTMRMKLFSNEIWSQTHQNSPAWDKKATAHIGDRFLKPYLMAQLKKNKLNMC